MEKMKKTMDIFRKSNLKKIANFTISKIEDYLSQKSIDLKTNKITPLSLPKSDVIRYWLNDNTKIVIRPSGTEPKIKIYLGGSELNEKNLNEGILKCDQKLNLLENALKNIIFS